MSELKPRVVIVGNAEVRIDHGSFVDASRHVMRFNLCTNYGRNTGTRTTILTCINVGATGRDAYRKRLWRGWPPAEQAEEIWFRSPCQGLLERAWLTLRHLRSRKQYFDYGGKILRANGMSDKHTRYTTRAEYAALERKLAALKDFGKRIILPSTGMIGIERALADPRFKGLEVYLLGFNWFAGNALRRSHDGHPFDEEEVIMRGYAEAGRLTILPGSEPAGEVRPQHATATLEAP